MASHFQLCAWRITLNTFYFGSKPHHPSLCSYFRGAATNSHHEFSCEDFLLLILTLVCWRQILLWNLGPLELRFASIVIATTIDSMLIVGRTDLCFLRIHLSQEATLLGLPPLLSFFALCFYPLKKSVSPNSVPLPGVISWAEVGILFVKIWSLLCPPGGSLIQVKLQL